MKKHYAQYILRLALVVSSIHATWASAPGEFSTLVGATGKKILCYRPRAFTAAATNREIRQTGIRIHSLDVSRNSYFFCSTCHLFDPAVARRFVMGIPPQITIIDVSGNNLPYNALTAFAPWLARKNTRFLNVRNNNRGADSDGALENFYRYSLNKVMDHKDAENAMTKIVWAPQGILDDLKSWDVLSPASYKKHIEYDLWVREPKSILLRDDTSKKQVRPHKGAFPLTTKRP